MDSFKIINNKTKILVILIFVFTCIGIFFMYNRLVNSYDLDVKHHNELLYNEAKSLFDSMVYARKWVSNHGGVYVKQEDDMQPSKYIFDNVIITEDDEKLIRINAASMTKQMSDLINMYDDKIYKMTSLQPINPDSMPDKFETKALIYFEQNPKADTYVQNKMNEVVENDLLKISENEKPMYHFMGKLQTGPGCVACHQNQEYVEGKSRGGIRISIPMQKHIDARILKYKEFQYNKIVFIFFAFLFLVALALIVYLIIKYQHKLALSNKELTELVDERTKELSILNEELEQRVFLEIQKSKDKDQLLISHSRHAAMGEMISMIAHQWRQPLSTISMDVNSMVVDIELDEINKDTFKEYAQSILTKTEYLSHTIDDFRNFFRVGNIKEKVKVSSIVNECFKITGDALGSKGIEFEVQTYEGEKERNIYSRELLQVLINLVNNAKDILLERNVVSPFIRVDIKSQNTKTLISVSDNGGGIPPEILGRMFEAYFTTKDQKDGTGLGLYMSKMIIDKHFNGTIEAVNTQEGASFIITI